MMDGLITSATLQHHSLAPHLLLSSASTSSSASSPFSSSQNVSLRAQLIPTNSLDWVFRCQGLKSRSSLCFWAPLVGGVRVESRGGSLVLDEEGGDEEEQEVDGLALYEEDLDFENEEDEGNELRKEQNAVPPGTKAKRTFRLLGNKEKKELRAYAHQLGNDICVHQVGKWGLTANCITAISDALEANELVKIRVLDNLDEELDDTAIQLESRTGAQIVGKMGRTLLLYRPSMRKLKEVQAAEERVYKSQRRKSLTSTSRTKNSKSFSGASRERR